jgi:diguanylate cyclase (GGDEF)-like protein/PAS domain S-box-containing protein
MSSLPIDPPEGSQHRRSGRNRGMLEPPEYTIQEAATKLGIAEQKLRRWDTQGVLVARRTEGGHRRYAREIIDGLAGSVSSVMPHASSDELDQAHQEIKEKRRIIQLLVESESRYRDLVETSHDLIWTTDAVGRFTYLNNGTADIFGTEPSALIGRCFFDFESRPSHVSNRRFLSTLRKHGEVRDYMAHLIAADGTDRWVGINARVWYDKGRIVGLRGTARNVTAQHRAALQIEHLATHDALTGLPNQINLLRTLEQSFAQDDSNGALLRIDIDHFKRVNDEYGHRAGDELLVGVANVIRNVVAYQDATVYRYGGDQFAVHLPSATNAEFEPIAEKLLHAFRQFTPAIEDSTDRLQITASIGIALYPLRRDNVATLLDNAEHAIHDAKASGRDRFVVFKNGSNDAERLNRRANWEHELRSALDENRLELYSQSAICLTGDGSGHRELLARIAGRNGEMIESQQFFRVAESLGLAPEIDLRVVEKVLEHIGKEEDTPDSGRYFVNLSRRSVTEPRWLARFRALLSESSADLGRLVLEISETTAMSNVEAAKTLFETVREAGCGCAIDNFGTGFSSMYYLKQFDVDYLKVDGSLSRELPNDEGSRLFVRTLCDVSKGLNKEVIAERVETSDVLAELRSLGIGYAQGNFVGRPRPCITFDGGAAKVQTP